MNKKGFTLVELLAVIVILAIVMLIAVTSVGPMMEKSRKNSLGDEGIALVKAAEGRFNEEVVLENSARFKSTNSVCFSMKYLCENGYFEKGCNDDYIGSVLIIPEKGVRHAYFWISNGTYSYLGSTKDEANDSNAIDYIEGLSPVLESCGNGLSIRNKTIDNKTVKTAPSVAEHSETENVDYNNIIFIYSNKLNVVKGDIDGDGYVDVLDASTLQRYINNHNVEFDERTIAAADLNCDNKINADDYSLDISLALGSPIPECK